MGHRVNWPGWILSASRRKTTIHHSVNYSNLWGGNTVHNTFSNTSQILIWQTIWKRKKAWFSLDRHRFFFFKYRIKIWWYTFGTSSWSKQAKGQFLHRNIKLISLSLNTRTQSDSWNSQFKEAFLIVKTVGVLIFINVESNSQMSPFKINRCISSSTHYYRNGSSLVSNHQINQCDPNVLFSVDGK